MPVSPWGGPELEQDTTTDHPLQTPPYPGHAGGLRPRSSAHTDTTYPPRIDLDRPPSPGAGIRHSVQKNFCILGASTLEITGMLSLKTLALSR